ncbi:hypothetical protein SAMN05444266_108147 [Chitinophaga jiangningensis]|uniref:Lipocalin-like domain-containing protein n=1 Tax=Chitinophaga jiangningensis TaxID=1419482 RepID=A0A1M7IYQ4_9BACT|nr:hypothetical protein [Chitinophaga jiangningensis]SHM45763.1 hypothetical protein SAMN05444266_108147 [Chitinophaga jiangningensis]
MIKSIPFILALFILTPTACDSPPPKTPKGGKNFLIGKWHRFSRENGYTEFDIDSRYIVFYNQKVGRFALAYKIENDSLKYLTNQYAAKITDYGDSVLVEGNDSTTATLYRFEAAHVAFNAIPEEKDSLAFTAYLEGFDKRLIREFEKAGIKFSDGPEQPEEAAYRDLLNKKL